MSIRRSSEGIMGNFSGDSEWDLGGIKEKNLNNNNENQEKMASKF